MAAFTVQMTGTNELSDAVLVGLNGSFQIAAAQQNILPSLAVRQFSNDPSRRDFSFVKINEIDSSVSAALLEYEDPNSVPLSGATSSVRATEFGRVVTTTSLADTISGGALGRQAAAQVGRDAGRWENLYALNTLAAGTNAMFAGTAGTNAGMDAGDVMTKALMRKAYTRLSLAGATKDALGYYRAILHPAQIHDLKAAVDAGSWTDVMKYSRPEDIIRGEIGAFEGFRIIESPLLLPTDQSGAGTVDVYKAVFFGQDALGQGVATPVSLRLTTSDKLARFYNYGWYSCQVFSIIDQGQVYVINTSSSEGVNAT